MAIKISAVIPYYNEKKDLLLECVQSILRQDIPDYEIIIVDDGSDEANAAQLEEIRLLDERIKVIRQANRGLSGARNTGAGAARGEYITFIDADDQITPVFFSEAYRVAKENNADFIMGEQIFTSSRDRAVSLSDHPKVEALDASGYKPSVITITDQFQGGEYFSRGAVARLVRRNVMREVPFQEDVRMGEDIIWNLDMLAHCEKVYRVHQIWYLYWTNPASMTHKYNPNMIPLCTKHLEEILCRIDRGNGRETAAYCHHEYEILSTLVYQCYLGKKESGLSVFQRNRLFCELCGREPWALTRERAFRQSCDRKTKIKTALIQCRLFYWALFVKDHAGRHKEIG